MKCPSGPQCPICTSPNSLQGQALLEQTELSCTSPVIHSTGRDPPLDTEFSEIQSHESFREPLGSASLNLSDQQGNSVDLSCNITHSSESQDTASPPDLSLLSSSSLPLALSLSLDCPMERQDYEKLWRILAYYSETAVHLERELMLSKAPKLAYRYRQAAETDGYYHTGVKASVRARPQWLLQPAISIQLNRAQSNRHKVQLIYSTRVSARPDPTSTTSSPTLHPWVLISTNQTTTAVAVAAGSEVELSCPLLSSGNPNIEWILPDGSKRISPSNSLESRLQASTSGLVLHKVQLSDAGVYYCIARAGRDVDVLALRLAVAETSVPPTGEQMGPGVTSTVGEPAILSCKASGSPVPQMGWLLPDGHLIQQGLATSGGLTIEPNGSLTLHNPSKRDAGYYRCIVVNQYGSDSLSMQLELLSQPPPLLRTSFSSGPQSAAGRSTKIRAPLLHHIAEGSGDEEEEDNRTLTGNRRRMRPLQPSPNRRYPIGKTPRRGPMRGPLRRGGALSSTDQRRNHFQNRHRVNANKQRIDPQKWADLLAKIRQKTAHNNNNQTLTTAKPIAEVMDIDKSEDRGVHGVDDNGGDGKAEGGGMEAETEGSSVDVPDLQEEGLQPIHPIFTEMQTHPKAKTDPETDTEIKKGEVSSTEKPTDIENKRETHIQTEKAAPQTEIRTTHETLKELVTSKPITGILKIMPETGEEGKQEANPSSSRVRPQKPRQGLLPNLVPNSRPQSPWNSRRRIGQRRRIINRPGTRPLTPPRPLPDPMNPKLPTETPETTTDQTDVLLLPLTTSSPVKLLTKSDHIRSGVTLNSLPSPVSYTLGVSSLKSASPRVTPSSLTSVYGTHIDPMSHSANIPVTVDFTVLNAPKPLPTQAGSTDAGTHISHTDVETHTHGIQTPTKPQTALSKHVDRPSNKHKEELERNLVGVPYVSLSSTSLSPTLSTSTSSTVPSVSTSATATEKITTPSATPQTTHSTHFTSPTTSEETLLTTTIAPATTTPITSATTVMISPKSNSIGSTTTMFITTANTTPRPTTPTTMTTTSATTSSIPSTTTSATTAISVTISPYPTATTATSSSATSTTRSTTITAPTTTRLTILAKTIPITTMTSTPSAPTTPTTTMASTTEFSSKRLNVGQVEHEETPLSGAPNHSRVPTDWKNPGANSIPDSDSSRLRWPSLPLPPAAPLVSSNGFK